MSYRRLPVFEPTELNHSVDAEVFEEHAQDDESLAVAAEDAIHVFDLLGCLVGSFVGLPVRPQASLTANVPYGCFHQITPRTTDQHIVEVELGSLSIRMVGDLRRRQDRVS